MAAAMKPRRGGGGGGGEEKREGVPPPTRTRGRRADPRLSPHRSRMKSMNARNLLGVWARFA
jgi:hypothetical protein